MKISLNRKSLSNILADVAPFVPTKANVDILKFSKITVKDGFLKVEACDGQNSIARYMPLNESDGEGEFLVEMQDFGKFISSVSSLDVKLETGEKEIVVKHNKGMAAFASGDTGLYPKQEEEEAKSMTIDPTAISDCIANASLFVGTDDFRPQMCAIYVHIAGKLMEYCATDTRMLAAGSVPLDKEYADIEFYITPAAIKMLRKMCASTDAVSIAVSQNCVTYKAHGKDGTSTVLRTSSVKGKFPDYKRVIPNGSTVSCSVDRDELAGAVRRMSIFCDESMALKMKVGMLGMDLSADNLLKMKRSEETVAHDGADGDVTIGMHVKYLLTALSSFNKGKVLMQFNDASRPVKFSQEDKKNFIAILSPVNLKQ